MAIEVVLEVGTGGVVRVALEQESVPGHDVACAVRFGQRLEIVHCKLGMNPFLSPLSVTYVVRAHGNGVALQQQEILVVAQGFIEHGQIAEAIGADDVLFGGGQHGAEDHEGKANVGNAGTRMIPTALEE